MENQKYWEDHDPMSDYYEMTMKHLRKLNTVEEVEKTHCITCSDNGHWGWCDGDWIICPEKWRIKEILGIKGSRYSSIRDQMPEVFARD